MIKPSGRLAPRPVLLAAIGYALYLPLLAGFLFHTSPAEAGWRLFGKYSAGYALVLLLLLVPAGAMPWVARALSRPTRIARADGRELVIAGWRKVAFVCAGCGLGLVAAGLIVEVVLALPAVFPQVGGLGAPPPAEVFFGKWPVRTVQNPHGWNGPNVEVVKSPRTYRVFLLGGSTTFLMRLDEKVWFSQRLWRSLERARPAWKVEVVNAASGAHNTLHSLVKYAMMVQDFAPDVVVVMHAINDADEGVPEVPAGDPWWRAFERDYSGTTEDLRYAAVLGGIARPQEPLWTESRVLGPLVQAVGSTFFTDLRFRGEWTDEERREMAEAAVTRPLPAFRRNLTTLGQLVRARGARFFIAAQPTMHRPGAVDAKVRFLSPSHAEFPVWADRTAVYDWATMVVMRRYNDAAREVAGQLGAHFVDLERVVPPRAEFFQEDDGLPDPIHLNAEGCALVAAALHEAILPFIPERPPATSQ